MIYLDAAATTSVRREVLQAMWPYLTGEFGNPSSHHGLGISAAKALAEARATVADLLGCRKSEVIFTSGGSEADNLAIKGIALARPAGKHLVTSPIEHEAVLESCNYLRRQHGFEVTVLPVDRFGLVGAAEAHAALRQETTLCTIMLANNEVGTIQPVQEIAQSAAKLGVPMHTDAVQAGGGLDVRVARLGVDALSLSGHKLGAPKGIGVLYLRGKWAVEPVIHGGGQERGRRSGTENVAGAVGFAVALRLAMEEQGERMRRLAGLRDELIQGVLAGVPTAMLTGHPTLRLPGSASFCFPGTSGEAVLLRLEERGIVCSSGSACAAGSDEPSHVLVAMGIERDVAQTAVRFTLPEETTEEDIRVAIGAVREAVESVQGLAANAAKR